MGKSKYRFISPIISTKITQKNGITVFENYNSPNADFFKCMNRRFWRDNDTFVFFGYLEVTLDQSLVKIVMLIFRKSYFILAAILKFCLIEKSFLNGPNLRKNIVFNQILVEFEHSYLWTSCSLGIIGKKLN